MGVRAKVGPDQEPATWFDYAVIIDPETGLPLSGAATQATAAESLVALEAIQAQAESTDPVNVTKSKSSPYFNGNVGSTKYLVATGAQMLTDYYIENPDASAKAYVQFFNAASTAAVTLGTTPPVRSIGLAAGEKANLSDLAIDFSAGIVIAGTTTATGSTTAATGVVVNLGYKAG